MISVIIPVYKTEQYIRCCLDSVAGQTYTDLEIILIDDGSPDGCPAICDEYAARDSRFRVWHCKNQGVSHARNIGLEQSRGEWICCVDSDDWLAPNMLETLLTIAKQTGAGTVCCGAFQGDEQQVTERNIWRHFKDNEHVYENADVLTEVIEQSATLWNKLLCGERARKLRFNENIRFAEDTLFLAEYLAQETKAAVTKECLYYYRKNREGNVVSAALNERHIDLLQATGMLYELLARNGAQVVGVERAVDSIIRVLALVNDKQAEEKYVQEVQALAEKVYPDAKKLLKRTNRAKQVAKYLIVWFSLKMSGIAIRVAKIFMIMK